MIRGYVDGDHEPVCKRVGVSVYGILNAAEAPLERVLNIALGHMVERHRSTLMSSDLHTALERLAAPNALNK